jgi:hypothetical protein
MTSPALLHLLARRAKRNRGAAGSQPVNVSGSEAAAGGARPVSAPASGIGRTEGKASERTGRTLETVQASCEECLSRLTLPAACSPLRPPACDFRFRMPGT